jgi:alkylation response protein AidB-like acyl-CoA dehydrogenase
VDFKFSDEQLMIKDSVERFVAERAGGTDRWTDFAELGWLGVGAPEDLGGFGGPLETLILMEAFGRGLVAEPYLTGVVFAGTILRGAGRTDLLARLMDGRERFAVAYEEPGARYDPGAVTAAVAATPSGGRLSGRKVRVIGVPAEATLLVSAKHGECIALFAVPAGAAGVQRHDYVTEDGRTATTIDFTHVQLEPAARIGEVDLLELGLDHANAAICAEAVGVMSVLHELTLGYLKERRQFGVAIGSFQALQHRMAEMFVELELARSMAYVAAMTVATEPDAGARARGISAARVQIARSGRFVGQNAIQLHGAIGMADEYRIGHYFKRMTTLERLLGDVDYHLARYVRIG